MSPPTWDDEAHYEIRVTGRLDESWSAWFDGFTIAYEDDTTVIVGKVVDQAALFGLLNKLNSLGLSIKLIQQRDEEEGSE